MTLKEFTARLEFLQREYPNAGDAEVYDVYSNVLTDEVYLKLRRPDEDGGWNHANIRILNRDGEVGLTGNWMEEL